jgi:hypothetical protein
MIELVKAQFNKFAAYQEARHLDAGCSGIQIQEAFITPIPSGKA